MQQLPNPKLSEEVGDGDIPISSMTVPRIQYRREGGCTRREYYLGKNGINVRCVDNNKKNKYIRLKYKNL